MCAYSLLREFIAGFSAYSFSIVIIYLFLVFISYVIQSKAREKNIVLLYQSLWLFFWVIGELIFFDFIDLPIEQIASSIIERVAISMIKELVAEILVIVSTAFFFGSVCESIVFSKHKGR